MKRMMTFIISMALSLCSLAQQAPISAVANLSLPVGAERINKSTLITRSRTFSIKSELQNSSYDKNLYKIDNLSLGLWDVNASDDDHRTLETIKAQALELLKLDDLIIVDDASIQTISNNRFLVINYHKGTSNYLKFVTKTVNKKSLNGVIESNINEKGKAKSVLNELLKTVSFKTNPN